MHMHYLIAVAVVFIRVSQVTDALVALFARIPDVKLHILRDDDIQVFHTGALADHLQSLMDRLVIGILFEGFAVLGDPVSVDQLRGDRGRVNASWNRRPPFFCGRSPRPGLSGSAPGQCS